MKEGFSLLIPTIQLRHFVMVNPSFTKRFQFSDLNILQSSTETMTARYILTSINSHKSYFVQLKIFN